MKPEEFVKPHPAEPDAVARQQEMIFARSSLSRRLVDVVPSPLLVINRHWQVVYANRATLGMFDLRRRQHLYGLREGESFHCLHARSERTDGGNAEACRICGVARAVALALQGEETGSDCRISCELAGIGTPLELRIRATPLEVDGEKFSILALIDISQEKRRAMLANACFHDLLNTLTGIRGLLDVLKHTDVAERPEICELLEQTTLSSIEEIMTLRLLEQAEDSQLTVCRQPLRSGEFLLQIIRALRRHPSAKGKEIESDPVVQDIVLLTDPTLLRRLLGNMMLNALEATDPGGTVRAGCRKSGDEIEFWVHNERPIPPDVQAQIFSRSFSTKGVGRGFGTYSIQMLGTLLGGRVGFSSRPETGTTFFAAFPSSPPSLTASPFNFTAADP